MNSITDSLSVSSVIQYIESHTVVAVFALVLLIVVLIILGKIARWVLRPVLKGLLAGGLAYACLFFLAWKDIFYIEHKWILLTAVLLFLITAIADLNRKK